MLLCLLGDRFNPRAYGAKSFLLQHQMTTIPLQGRGVNRVRECGVWGGGSILGLPSCAELPLCCVLHPVLGGVVGLDRSVFLS